MYELSLKLAGSYIDVDFKVNNFSTMDENFVWVAGESTEWENLLTSGTMVSTDDP